MSFVHDVNALIADATNPLLARHSSWTRVRLGDVSAIINGFPFESRYFDKSEGAPLLRIRDILAGETATFYKGPAVEGYWINAGDLVVGMDGDFNTRMWTSQRALLNQRVCKIDPDERYLSREFLAYTLPGYLKFINEHTSSLTVKHLSSRTLADLLVPLPPRKEQERIVAAIDALFTRLDAVEAGLETTERLLRRFKQSVLVDAVTGRLTQEWRSRSRTPDSAASLLQRVLTAKRQTARDLGKNFEEPRGPGKSLFVDLPETWCWASVGQLAEVAQYGTSAKCNSDSTGVPVLRMGNLVDGRIDITDLKYLPIEHDEFPALLLESGDILFNRTNSYELVGKTAVFRESGAFSFASYLIRVRVKGMLPEFLSCFINSSIGRNWIASVVSQQVGQANVNGTKLRALTVPLPPTDEQEEIVKRLSSLLDGAREAAERVVAHRSSLISIRQSILSCAFRGELVQQDQTDEPAEQLLERIRTRRLTGVEPKRRRARGIQETVT